MPTIIEADGLSKRYGRYNVLDHVSFRVEAGRIVGVVGRNGAGKTTLLKALLGLTPYEGGLSVFGLSPARDRNALMGQICFIADTAVLPRWLSVAHALDYVAGVHPRFDRTRAEAFLARTSIGRAQRVGELSKGMITQLHLALILAIDARLLVLDEPTLGLDLLYRREFYNTLLNDYFDKERTIVVATHQVEEVEHLLTDVLFIDRGNIVLDSSIETLEQRYVQLTVTADRAAAARAFGPFYEYDGVFGRKSMLFEQRPREQLAQFGEVGTPGVAELFIAKMQAGTPRDIPAAATGTAGETA